MGSTVSYTGSGITIDRDRDCDVGRLGGHPATLSSRRTRRASPRFELYWRITAPDRGRKTGFRPRCGDSCPAYLAVYQVPGQRRRSRPRRRDRHQCPLIGGKADRILPLKPNTILNAIPFRYGTGTPPGSTYVSELTTTYGWNAASLATRGEPNVIRSSAPIAVNTFKTLAITVLPTDLARIGVVPNDTTPPTISVRVGLLKSNLVGVLSTWLAASQAGACVQIWVGPRYGLSAATPSWSTTKDRIWTNVSAAALYNSAGATTGTATRTEDATRVTFIRNAIPLPATSGGDAFTAFKIMLVVRGADGSTIAFDADQLAIVAGNTISATADYLNGSEDVPQKRSPWLTSLLT